jgi:cytochrome c oxidase cbb3-type subunit 2
VSVRPGALALVAAVFGLAASAPGQSPDLAVGERVFRDNCAVCHGAAGDGQGMAANHFKTPPRDLTKGRFKFRSTASGQVPTDGDLARTIVQGVPSTGMVPQNHLSDADVQAVIAFVKSLSPRFAAMPSPKIVAIPTAPPPTPEAVARGAKAYVKGECAECHGKEARGDGPSAKDLSVKPSDLTRRPLKSGPTARDIVRTLLTGLDGTPMPSYYQVLEDDEIWDLAYWLASRGGAPETTDDERAGWHVVKMHQRRSL